MRPEAAARLGDVIVSLVAPDGDAVVFPHAQLPPGLNEGFPSATKELGEVHQVGLAFLFICEMDVGQNFNLQDKKSERRSNNDTLTSEKI